MHELQNKHKLKRLLYSPVVLSLLTLLTLFSLRGVYGIVEKERESATQRREVEDKVSNLTKRESEIKADMARLETEQGVREEIKSKLNVAKEGEYMALIIDPKPSGLDNATSSSAWYKRLWNAILSR